MQIPRPDRVRSVLYQDQIQSHCLLFSSISAFIGNTFSTAQEKTSISDLQLEMIRLHSTVEGEFLRAPNCRTVWVGAPQAVRSAS